MERERLQDFAEFVQGYLETVDILMRILEGYMLRYLRNPQFANAAIRMVSEEIETLISVTRNYLADIQKEQENLVNQLYRGEDINDTESRPSNATI